MTESMVKTSLFSEKGSFLETLSFQKRYGSNRESEKERKVTWKHS